jgi:ankyrin repeat protein
MNGFVGVATYLIELGVNINYPPAEGEGRTAFEAAAENGRIDMMLLLIQSGVKLHLKF